MTHAIRSQPIAAQAPQRTRFPLNLVMTLILAGWMASPSGVQAQPLVSDPKAASDVPAEASPPPPEVSPSRIRPVTPPQPQGSPYQMGSFTVYPEIDVVGGYDSNVYYSNTSPVSDEYLTLSPSILLQSNWAEHALNIRAGADFIRYRDLKDENIDDANVSVEGRRDISPNMNVYGGGYLSTNHEDRESPDVRNGLTPTRYTQNRFYAGFFRSMGPWSVRVAGNAMKLDYRDVDFVTGGGAIRTINNDDRDHWQHTGGVRVAYEWSPELEGYAQVAADHRRYSDAVDDLGYQRSSTGMRYLIGAKWSIPEKTMMDAYVGHMSQDYDDVRSQDVSKPMVGGKFTWFAGPRTTLVALVDRTIEETSVTQRTSAGVLNVASSYVNTYGSLELSHKLSEQWSVRAASSLSRVAYQGIVRSDDYRSDSVGVTYKPHRRMIVNVDLIDRRLKSSLPTENFSKTMAMIRLTFPFMP